MEASPDTNDDEPRIRIPSKKVTDPEGFGWPGQIRCVTADTVTDCPYFAKLGEIRIAVRDSFLITAMEISRSTVIPEKSPSPENLAVTVCVPNVKLFTDMDVPISVLPFVLGTVMGTEVPSKFVLPFPN